MNDDLIEIFWRHYNHEIPLSLEDFKVKCLTDADFKKKNVYLFHPSYMKDDVRFFRMIDYLGGWPPSANSVVLQHQTNRACYFSKNTDIRNEWNTSIVTADEYYWWKLSDLRKEEFRKEIYKKVGQDLLSKSHNL